jgi:hypothetical protein
MARSRHVEGLGRWDLPFDLAMEISPILIHRIKSVLTRSLKAVDLAASTNFGVSYRRLKRICLRFS